MDNFRKLKTALINFDYPSPIQFLLVFVTKNTRLNRGQVIIGNVLIVLIDPPYILYIKVCLELSRSIWFSGGGTILCVILLALFIPLVPREFFFVLKINVQYSFIVLICYRLSSLELTYKSRPTIWLVYWIIYVLFLLIEYWRYTYIHMIKGYWLVKFVFLIWLMLPGKTGGTHIIYDRIIARFLLRIFQVIFIV